MTPLEFNIFFGAKLFYAFYMFVLPSIYGVHSGGSFFTLYVAAMVCQYDPSLCALVSMMLEGNYGYMRNSANGDAH
jgi:hypothetical protein